MLIGVVCSSSLDVSYHLTKIFYNCVHLILPFPGWAGIECSISCDVETSISCCVRMLNLITKTTIL